MLEDRWQETLKEAVRNLLAQPGKQAVLELLPKPPLRPPVGAEHRRIPPDRNFLGETSVHTFASLGLVPVYQVHNDRARARCFIPGGGAAAATYFGPGSAPSEAAIHWHQLGDMSNSAMPSQFYAPSMLFRDLRGHDVHEAVDFMPVLLSDLPRFSSLVAETPEGCREAFLHPVSLVPADKHRKMAAPLMPRWVLYRLLERNTVDAE